MFAYIIGVYIYIYIYISTYICFPGPLRRSCGSTETPCTPTEGDVRIYIYIYMFTFPSADARARVGGAVLPAEIMFVSIIIIVNINIIIIIIFIIIISSSSSRYARWTRPIRKPGIWNLGSSTQARSCGRFSHQGPACLRV